MACINHLCAAPSNAFALLLSSIEISGVPGCAVDRGLFCLWFLESGEAVKPFLDKLSLSRQIHQGKVSGSEKHPQFIFPSIQLHSITVQFGFVVVVMILGPKAEGVMPKVDLSMEGL